MENIKLSPPWVTYAKKIQALFDKDPQIKFEYIEDSVAPELKIFVENAVKAEAIEAILPVTKEFGNVELMINVIPGNESDDITEIYRDAFRDNPIIDHIRKVNTPYGDSVTFVSFVREVVQFFDDNMFDENGVLSTIYQDIASELFEDDMPAVSFCTAVDDEER